MKGPFVPNAGVPFVVGAGPDTGIPGGGSGSVGAIRVAVTAAGSLMASYKETPGVNVELHYPVAGVYIEIGHIAQLWKGASPPTLVPADTVVLLSA
jgi:hypothetical protein